MDLISRPKWRRYGGKKGTYTLFGEFYKMNLDVKGGHNISFHVKLAIFTPKIAEYTKAKKYVNEPPKGYVPSDATSTVATMPSVEGSVNANSSVASTANANSTNTPGNGTNTSSPGSPGSPGSPLDITGAVSGKRKFVE